MASGKWLKYLTVLLCHGLGFSINKLLLFLSPGDPCFFLMIFCYVLSLLFSSACLGCQVVSPRLSLLIFHSTYITPRSALY